MANAHSSNRVNRKKGRDRHRAEKHTPEAYAWLGAGAVSFGIGAAIVSGAGVASADTGTDGTSASTTQAASEQPSNGGGPQSKDTPGSKPESTFGSGRDDEAGEESGKTGSNTASVGLSGSGPITSVSASGGNVKTQISDDKSTSVVTPLKSNSEARASGLDEPDERDVNTGLQTLAFTASVAAVVDPDSHVSSKPAETTPRATNTSSLTTGSTQTAMAITTSATAPQDPAVIAEITFGDFVEGLRDLVIDPSTATMSTSVQRGGQAGLTPRV
jgi:hypothetical protein